VKRSFVLLALLAVAAQAADAAEEGRRLLYAVNQAARERGSGARAKSHSLFCTTCRARGKVSW